MTTVVAILGAIITLLGISGLTSPDAMKWVGSRFRTPSGMVAAVVIRVVAGVLLILAGPSCRPDMSWVSTTVQMVGGLAIAAAVLLLFIGPARFRATLDWSLNKPPAFLRGWSLIAIVLGGFLLYAGT